MSGDYHRIRIDIRISYCRHGGGSESMQQSLLPRVRHTRLGLWVRIMKGGQRVMQPLAALFGRWHPGVLPFAPSLHVFLRGHEHGAPTSAPRHHDGLEIRDGATCIRT